MTNDHKLCPLCNVSQHASNEVCDKCDHVFEELVSSNAEKIKYKKRQPILAIILQIATPGLGNLYNGQLKKAYTIYIISLSIVILLTPNLLSTFVGMIVFLIIALAFFLYIIVDAFRSSIRLKKFKLRPYNKWYIYLLIIFTNIILIPFIPGMDSDNYYKAYKIPSGAMKPTLLIGDHLIANEQAYLNEKPLRGDIVIFKWPEDESKDFIKRVVGIEGDVIEIKNDILHINNEKVDRTFSSKFSDKSINSADVYEEVLGANKHFILDQFTKNEGFGPVTVPENSIFVMGDNRDNSLDSRYWGFVKLNKIKGKALYIYWAKDKSRLGLQIN